MNNKIKIYCLPYAGGSKSIYNDWIKTYADIAEIVPLEYKGHGEFFCESAYNSLEEAADDMCLKIMADSPHKYIVYGHSLGSIIALLTAELLEKKYGKKPEALIIGGIRPAHLKYKDEKLLNLPKEEFMNHIFDLGMTSEEIKSEPELVDIIYEIIHNDVKIEELYKYIPDAHSKLTVPIVVMTGDYDNEAPLSDMKEWQMYTDSRFYIKNFPSDHFFPFNCNEFETYFRSVLKKIIFNML